MIEERIKRLEEELQACRNQIEECRALLAIQGENFTTLAAKFEANVSYEAWLHGALMKAFPPIGDYVL